jgi:hypothetical protein
MSSRWIGDPCRSIKIRDARQGTATPSGEPATPGSPVPSSDVTLPFRSSSSSVVFYSAKSLKSRALTTAEGFVGNLDDGECAARRYAGFRHGVGAPDGQHHDSTPYRQSHARRALTAG